MGLRWALAEPAHKNRIKLGAAAQAVIAVLDLENALLFGVDFLPCEDVVGNLRPQQLCKPNRPARLYLMNRQEAVIDAVGVNIIARD